MARAGCGRGGGGREALQRVALAAVALAALGAPRPASAQTPEGLDVVVLVDVSRSMFQARSGAPGSGSDPDRIRWDAVHLLVDMLTADDRVLIVPFNEHAPAKAREAILMPGPLPGLLLPATDARRTILPMIESFAHAGDDDRNRINTDQGSTAIVHALRAPARLAGERRPETGRRLAAVLLTDGKEEVSPDEARRRNITVAAPRDADLAVQLGEWKAGRAPVYTVGLGELADEALLLRIANVTGGGYTKARTNHDLIRVFRRLLWDLKGCWVKSIEPDDPRSVQTGVAGVVDAGALAYARFSPPARIDGRPDPRDTRPPARPLRIAWSADTPAPGGAASPEHRTGKGGGGYSYDYLGPSSPERPGPFADAPPGTRLVFSWDEPLHVEVAKRTAQPLLDMVAPGHEQTFDRYDALVVCVALRPSDHFRPEHFRLHATLTPQGGGEGVEDDLVPEPATRVFRCSLALDRLPRQPVDRKYYTLRVVADGAPGAGHALEGFQLELPKRTVAVRNTLRLNDAPRIELSRDQDREASRLELQAAGAAPESLRLRWELDPPRGPKGPIDPRAVVVTQVLKAGDLPPGEHALSLRRGSAVVDVTLDPDYLPEVGVPYADGRLRITGEPGSGLEPWSAPVGLRLGLVKLKADPPAASAEAAPKGGRSEAIRVAPARAADARLLKGPIRVSLAPAPGATAFGPGELWLEPLDGPPPPEPAQRLDVGPGEAFRAVFRPLGRADGRPPSLGRHAYSWSAEAPGAEKLIGSLTLDHNAPALVAPEPTVIVRARAGATVRASIPLKLRGQPGDRSRAYFRPDRLDGERPLLKCYEPDLGETSAVGVDYPGVDQALALDADAPDEAESAIVIGFDVPADLPYGRYRLGGAAVGSNAREAPLTVELHVNGLEVLAENPYVKGDWRALPRVELGLLQFGRKVETRVRVRTRLGDRLQPDQVRLTAPGPFRNEEGDVRRPLPKIEKADVPSIDGGRALEFVVRFETTGNARPYSSYTFSAFAECPSLGLEQGVEFALKFFDPAAP